MINIIFLIALILVIWFRSDAWLEYTKLLHLNYISKYKEYNEVLKRDSLLEYHTFLRRYYNCFLIRLITCPVCFSIWLGIIFGILTYLSMIPIYSIGGLTIYLLIDKLIG